MNDNTYRYDAFISYRHVEPDRAYAKWLRKALENYRVPAEMVAKGYPKRIGRVCRDEEELPASSNLSQQLNTILEQSRFLIVICSPRVVESAWCDAEVLKFREMGRHDQIIALLIEGEPSQSFLPSLREIRKHVIRDDGTRVEELESVEPLAADVRHQPEQNQRELKHLAKLRILATILGCKFDDLRRRELRRRQRQMAIAMASAIALLVCFSGLALWALHERGLAIEQTGVAEQQTRLANKQTGIAEKQTRVAERQTELAKKNAKEVSRKLAQHYQYRANEMLNDTVDYRQEKNELAAITLLTEAMRVSEPYRESPSERVKLQSLLKNRLIPRQLYHHETPQTFSAFKNDVILTCGLDKTVQLWDARSNRKIGQALSFDEPLEDVEFSKNGDNVAIFDAKYTWIIDCSTGKLLSKPLEIFPNYKYSDQYALMPDRPVVSDVKFIGDSSIAVMCSAALKVFNIRTGKVEFSGTRPEDYTFRSFMVLDSQHLLVGLRPSFGAKGNHQSKSQVISILDTTIVEDEDSASGRLIMSGTGTALVVEDKTISLRHLVEDRILIEIPKKRKHFIEASASPDSKVAVAYANDDDPAEVYLIDANGKQILTPEFDRENISNLFLLDDRHLLVAYHSSERRIEVWDFRAGQLKAATPVEDLPDLCCINDDVDKVAFTSEERIYFWDFKSGLNEGNGSHLNPVKQLAFSGSNHCLSSDGELIKKWAIPSSDTGKRRFTWTHGKFDFLSKLVFEEDLIAFPCSNDDKNYFTVYDQHRDSLIADSIEIPDCDGFHWTPCRCSVNGDFFMVPHFNRQGEKRLAIWDTQSKELVQLNVPVAIEDIVRITRSELVYLGPDQQIHFHSFSESKHESVMLGPLLDSHAQLSPDNRVALIEGKKTAYIVDLEARKLVFDEYFIWPPNEECWLQEENAVWCVAKKKFSKINWLSGEVLVERSHRDDVSDLTCLAERGLIVSHGADMDDGITMARSLKFWDLAGNDLNVELPLATSPELYRSMDDEHLHVKDGESFKTISTVDLKVTVQSDPFLKEHVKTARITASPNRKYMVFSTRNGEFRVYDPLTMQPLSKPFALKDHRLVKAIFHTFQADGEIMIFSGQNSIDLYQTSTGYKITSIPVADYFEVPRDTKRLFRVIDSPVPNQLILANETRNQLAFLDIPIASQDFEILTLLQTVITEQQVDSTNAVVPKSKLEVTNAFRQLHQIGK